MGNTFKTAFLLTALTLLLMFIGRIFGGQNGMLIALVIAGVLNFVSYFFSDRLALAMYHAQPVTREELSRAYEIVERLTQKIGLPMPKIYVIPTESPNAFATGRNPNHASVAVTLAGAITWLRYGAMFGGMGGRDNRRDGGMGALIMLIVAPIAAALIQLAVSRSREYQADETGAHFTGNPYALASALAKLDAYSKRV